MTLLLAHEDDYRSHYIQNFTKRPVPLRLPTGSAPVYFSPGRFDHAFFESSLRDGQKDQFSLERARRMDEISNALQDLSLDRRAGWDPKKGCHHTSSVILCVDDFVVIIRFTLNRQGRLKGKFVTCFVADNSISKIRQNPAWSENQCMQELVKRA